MRNALILLLLLVGCSNGAVDEWPAATPNKPTKYVTIQAEEDQLCAHTLVRPYRSNNEKKIMVRIGGAGGMIAWVDEQQLREALTTCKR